MSRDEKAHVLETMLRSLWLVPFLGSLSMIALLVWGVASGQVMVVIMALSVMVVIAIGWAATRDGVKRQLAHVR